MRLLLAATLLVTTDASARATVVAKTNIGSCTVIMQRDAHTGEEDEAISLTVTPKGKKPRAYKLPQAALKPSASFAQPLLSVVKVENIAEPLLMIRYSDTGDDKIDFALSTVLARVSPEGELTPVLSTDVMVSSGGECGLKETLTLEPQNSGMTLTKHYASKPKFGGNPGACPAPRVASSSREYKWNGHCFERTDVSHGFDVVNEEKCSAHGLEQGDELVFVSVH